MFVEIIDRVDRSIALRIDQAVHTLGFYFAEIEGEIILLLLGQMLVAKHP